MDEQYRDDEVKETTGEETVPEPEVTFAEEFPKQPEAGSQPVMTDPWAYPPAAQEIPPMQKIDFTPVTPEKEHKSASKGLKLFSLLLAAALLFTAGAAGGYLFSRYYKKNTPGKTVEVNLAAKPKDTDEMTAGEVYEAVKDSVAGILAYDKDGKSLLSSGVFFTEDGYLVTNDHIYEKISEPSFYVYTADGKQYEAEFVAGDSISDLSVLKVKEGTFKPAVFGDPAEMFCGENMVVMENIGESGNRVTISKGTVISTGFRVRSSTTNYSQRLILTDNTVLSSATGGALVNMYGQVLGLTRTTDGNGVCYSIPSKLVKRYVEDMIKNGRVTTRAKLGITYSYVNEITKTTKEYQHTGARIEESAGDSDLTGKVSKGDIIIAYNGTQIKSEDDLLNRIEDSAAKSEATITVVDESGDEKTVTFVLGANIGESSYHKEISSGNSDNFGGGSGSGGTFDFPRGE